MVLIALLMIAGLGPRARQVLLAAGPPGGNPLATLKSLCVGNLVGPEPLRLQVQEMIIAELFGLKRFTITENCTGADAVLKGAVMEVRERRVRGEAEDTAFGGIVGAAGVRGDSGSATIAGVAGGSGESLVSAETVTRASLTLRIVDHEGEVLWAHSEESGEGKQKSAVSLAIDRAIKRLVRDRDAPGGAP